MSNSLERAADFAEASQPEFVGSKIPHANTIRPQLLADISEAMQDNDELEAQW